MVTVLSKKSHGPHVFYPSPRIVLSIEDKLNFLEQLIPPALVVPAGQHIALEILAAHTVWIKGSKEIQAEQELLQTTRDFHSCKQEEGQSISSYVLKMKGYIDNLEHLRHPMTLGLCMGKRVNELHVMLKLHEQTLPKNNASALYAVRAGKVQKVNKHKKSQPQMAARGQNHGKGKNKLAYAPKPKIPPPPKREDLAKDSICHECGAGGSGIFVLELNTILNRSWIYDTGCGTHIFNTMHGLRVSRKLKPGLLACTSIYAVSNKRAKLDLDSALMWHCRLGHISKKRIEKFQHDGLLNSTDLRAFEKYVSCMFGKMARKPYTHQVERAKDLLRLIHTDVCGPSKIMSRQGANYFITFTDDFSRYGYVYLLKHKHEVFETFKVFKKKVENQLGKTIKSPCFDRRGEYMSQEFLDHLKDHGTISHRTLLYTSQHNGVSERRNKTLLDMVRFMMSQTTLLKSFRDYALEPAERILNMVPTKKVEKTPYERDTLTKPDKLEPRSIKCIFIGYPKETMRYSFYYPPENKVLVARNAEFLENSLITQEASGSLEDLEIIQEEDTHPSIDTSLNHEEDDLEIDEPQSKIIPIRRSIRTRHASDRMCLYIDAEKHGLGDLGEPANYKAALLDPESKKWFNAMNVKMQSMKDNEV
nr:hypothetical protein [Tanacetum cinerariifolium]